VRGALLALAVAGCSPLVFTITPSEARAGGELGTSGLKTPLRGRLQNRGSRVLIIGTSELGNVHIDSLACGGKPVRLFEIAPASDCCYAMSCTGYYSGEVQKAARELAPAETIEIPIRLRDEIVEPGELYRQRVFQTHPPERCEVRFVYRPSGLVDHSKKRITARSNAIAMELVAQPPLPKRPDCTSAGRAAE